MVFSERIAEMDKTMTALEVENEVKERGTGEAEALTFSLKRRPLLPILLQHPVPAGALIVDREETRVGARREIIAIFM